MVIKPEVNSPKVKLRTISYGGGVQSTAMCVLAAQGKIDHILGGPLDAAVFANVGNDSEHPDTLEYINTVMKPWMKDHKVKLVEVQHVSKGRKETLLEKINDEKSIPIPIKFANGAPANRTCTSKFKINAIHKWIKSQGVSYKSQSGTRNHESKLTEDQVAEIKKEYTETETSVRKLALKYQIGKSQVNDILNDKYWKDEDSFAVVAIGISTDEIHRIRRKREEPHEIVVYPLIELGLSRQDCERIISEAGLPVPPKSACFFCPFHGKDYWIDLKASKPELWEKSVEIEKTLNVKRINSGKDPVYLAKAGVMLDELDLAPSGEEEIFNEGACDEGVCWI